MFGFGTAGFIDGNAIYYLYTNGLLFIMLILASTPRLKNAFSRIQLN